MKIEITMIDNVIITYEGNGITFDEFVGTLGAVKNKGGFVNIKSSNGTIAINPNKIITVREVR